MQLSHFKMLTATFAVTLALGTAIEASAVNRNWRLNPDESAKADFVSIKAAMEDERVIPGDILILDPGYYDEETSITKDNITICGSGYLLSQNFDYSETASAIVKGLNVSANEVTVSGCYLNSFTTYSQNTSLYKCCVEVIEGLSSLGGGTRTFTRLSIEQCFLTRFSGSMSFENCIIRNNIILRSIPGSINNCTLEHNTIIHNDYNFVNINNSVIKNNIIINKNESKGEDYCAIKINTSDNNQFNNNVFSTPAEEADKNYPNNKYVGATVENTFVDEIRADRYFIREGSIALKAASDGGQCGAFGGRSPYVLSGIPDYTPHITEVQIPAKPTDNKLNVKLKIAIRDE